MEKEKSYWLSYDLGVGGNYEKLYGWLDDHNAVPCGESVAFFKFPYEGEDPDEQLKEDLLRSLELRAGNKLYLIRLSGDGQAVGNFIYGKRNAAPWIGYGTQSQSGTDK